MTFDFTIFDVLIFIDIKKFPINSRTLLFYFKLLIVITHHNFIPETQCVFSIKILFPLSLTHIGSMKTTLKKLIS